MKQQKYSWSCGAAAVRNVFRSFGIRVQESSIRTAAGTTKEYGTCEKGIINAVREWGFKAVGYHFDNKDDAWKWIHEALSEGKKVILCVENWEHWVVALGSNGPSGVIVFDSSNCKVNVYENCVHLWDKKKLMYKWWNDRRSIDDEVESRLYAISVGK